MAYQIVVMPLAVADLEASTRLIAKDSKAQARKWLRDAWDQIFSLATMPERFPVIDESAEIGTDVREVLHHSHRIIYRVKKSERTIEILRVWHSARRPLGSSDLPTG